MSPEKGWDLVCRHSVLLSPDPCSSSEDRLGICLPKSFSPFLSNPPRHPRDPWSDMISHTKCLLTACPLSTSSCIYSSSRPLLQPWQYLYGRGRSQGDQLAENPALQHACGSVTGPPRAGKIFSPTSRNYLGG